MVAEFGVDPVAHIVGGAVVEQDELEAGMVGIASQEFFVRVCSRWCRRPMQTVKNETLELGSPQYS